MLELGMTGMTLSALRVEFKRDNEGNNACDLLSKERVRQGPHQSQAAYKRAYLRGHSALIRGY